MSAATSLAEKPEFNVNPAASVTAPQSGHQLEIGTGFTARSFRERDFSGAMDPLVMVDHYRMSESTFGAHPHVGLSAVSILFEDSEGKFHNRDSLGNDFDLMPGDLYWLKAGSGAVHDEAPRAGARTHGLQVFVNLPARMKQDAPESLRVKAQDMPILETDGNRVRIVLGDSNGITGQVSPALPMTILDGRIAAGSTFAHELRAGENSWVYAVEGGIEVIVAGEKVRLRAGESIAIEATSGSATNTIEFTNVADSGAHFALFAALPVREAFVQKGPLVMNNEAEIAQVEADHAAGKLGRLESPPQN
ncbi:MAG: pirin family protein [Gammaproteobacteria bacterium]|nr:pirin family protein [Gammaproteobacteria bacterium]